MRAIVRASLAISLISASAAVAEPLQVTEAQWKPYTHYVDGRMDGCGLSFDAMASAKAAVFNVQGSVVIFWRASGVQFLSMKVVVLDANIPGTKQRKVTRASMRTTSWNTKGLDQVESADDGMSRLIVADAARSFKFFSEFLDDFVMGSRIGFSLDGDVREYSIRLSALDGSDASTVAHASDCKRKMLTALKLDLK